MNRLHCRAAVRADAERIAFLHADSWKRTYRGSYRDRFLDGDVVTNRLEVWCSRLAHEREDQFVYVAEMDSKLLGFVCAFGNEDRIWGSLIDNLHVSHECQRTGLGTSLMQDAGTWLTSRYRESGVTCGRWRPMNAHICSTNDLERFMPRPHNWRFPAAELHQLGATCGHAPRS